ncbi:hypothetical protein PHET_12362 [Paragonimus heterotremus]|uniref:Peptidase S1 domain-containing protein n=1 Tax=Paragonimus heterotremus TaxID=100268 RepID=A0A8J4SMV1_9TREM|nr:hypothetical protein PHET_12362 [Paragonimus heterotremus]
MNVDYDIALVKSTGSIPLNDSRVAAAKLPGYEKGSKWISYNAQCAISGWGCARDNGPQQETARAVWMGSINKQECVDLLDRTFQWRPEIRFCIKDYKYGGATCLESFVW